MIVPSDTRAASWTKPDGHTGGFLPRGKKNVHGDKSFYTANRERWESHTTWSARLFVGFNVGDKTIYDMDDLVAIVRRVREKQTGDPSSSFIYQKGIYRHSDGEVVEEPGAQIVIINTSEKPRRFSNDMNALAETIAEEMDQEEVVVEIQKNGAVQSVRGVGL